MNNTKRITVPAIEDILEKKLPVLDHGFVRVIDYMGDDSAIVQAARVSYGKGTKTVSEDRGLIRYLMRNKHSTPMEMCEIKLHVKLPIFVARQWIRHRTANVNEYSARYSILDNEFYIPDILYVQSKDNKQGRGEEYIEHPFVDQKDMESISSSCYDIYENLLKQGVAREIARIVLPVNYYTEWYWKIDLHNLLHFLSLRADPHAQFEIREYANIICDIVKKWVPHTWEAFEDYRTDGKFFSKQEVTLIKQLIDGDIPVKEESGLSEREWKEFKDKLDICIVNS